VVVCVCEREMVVDWVILHGYQVWTIVGYQVWTIVDQVRSTVNVSKSAQVVRTQRKRYFDKGEAIWGIVRCPY
jgi:hypothetical protein